MLVHGFNESAVYAYRWLKRDLCRWYDRKQVLKLPVKTEGEIYLCACYGDGCNGSPRLSAAVTYSHLTRLPVVFTVPLVVTIWTHLVHNHQMYLWQKKIHEVDPETQWSKQQRDNQQSSFPTTTQAVITSVVFLYSYIFVMMHYDDLLDANTFSVPCQKQQQLLKLIYIWY